MLITPTAKSSDHQRPAAADAPATVLTPIRTAPRGAVVPVVHDEAERRPAVRRQTRFKGVSW